MRSVTKLSPITFSAVFAALGACVQVIEDHLPLPMPLPGGKLGLSNVVIMVILKSFGIKYALAVSVIKSFIAILISGRVTGLVYSLAGGIFSVIAMYLAGKYIKKAGSVGCGIIGAWTNNIMQTTVGAIIMSNIHIMAYIWVLGPVSVVTGAFTGFVAEFIGRKMKVWTKD